MIHLKDVFDPYNIKHIKAYQELCETGSWHLDSFPDVDRAVMYLEINSVQSKMATAWLEEKVAQLHWREWCKSHG